MGKSGEVWELILWNVDKGVIVLCMCRTEQWNSDIQGMGIEVEVSEIGQDFRWYHGGGSVPLINMSRVCRRGQNLKVRYSYKVWN